MGIALEGYIERLKFGDIITLNDMDLGYVMDRQMKLPGQSWRWIRCDRPNRTYPGEWQAIKRVDKREGF